MFLGKQKFDVKQLKLNKFIFDVKQLKIKKNYKWRQTVKDEQIYKIYFGLFISTSNATLEAPSLRPCK